MRRFRFLELLIAIVVLPRAVHAAAADRQGSTAPSPRLTSPMLLRFEVDLGGQGWGLFESSANSVSALALTFGYSLTKMLSIEGTLGTGSPAGDGGSLSPGTVGMLAARAAVFDPRGPGRNALTIAAGPMMIEGGVYGPVGFAHAEAGYEYRGTMVTFLLTAGPDVVLADSRVPPMSPGCAAWFGPPCPRQFAAGSVFPHFRIGLGVTF